MGIGTLAPLAGRRTRYRDLFLPHRPGQDPSLAQPGSIQVRTPRHVEHQQWGLEAGDEDLLRRVERVGRDQGARLGRAGTVLRIRRHARRLCLVERARSKVQGCGDRLYRPERQRCECRVRFGSFDRG